MTIELISIIFPIIYFLLFQLVRAVITKYLFLNFSINPPSIIILFKKYFMIALIIFIPFIFFGVLYEYYGEQYFGISSEDLFSSNILLIIVYLLEAVLITKIIKDANGNKILFKIAFMLVIIFSISDFVLDQLTLIITENFDLLMENEISSILSPTN